ncbi:hypothetical protein RF11_14479 [Thelohanellus kitauei]|uniref:Uncharacterized protein n=1 Tax=Thelohanellus kitauei TaxID=669202 RepID=A0A0C2NLU8_THEKT|nr:hypothetical protein RF11_14479 [Thelohanellus kitauei]
MRNADIYTGQIENQISDFDDDIIGFFSREMDNTTFVQIFPDKLKHLVEFLMENRCLDVTQVLGGLRYAWKISTWGSRISLFSGGLHSLVNSLIRERNKNVRNSDMEALYNERAQVVRNELFFWVIAACENSRRAQTPDITPLIQKLIRAKLPENSEISLAILKSIEIALPHINHLYQANRHLRPEGMF